MHELIAPIAPLTLAILGVLMGWLGASLRHRPHHRVPVRTQEEERRIVGALHGIYADAEPDMCRPVEFGPIMQPREVIDRIRDAIVEDQLGARKESPKQRRQRMTRLAGFTDRQRVQHWLLHWREDYMADLTGRARGIGWGITA